MSGEQHRQRRLPHRDDVEGCGQVNRARDVRRLQCCAHERASIDRLQRGAYDGCQVAAKLRNRFQ